MKSENDNRDEEGIVCVNCDASLPSNNDTVCMLCGGDLCSPCYDESPYCNACTEMTS